MKKTYRKLYYYRYGKQEPKGRWFWFLAVALLLGFVTFVRSTETVQAEEKKPLSEIMVAGFDVNMLDVDEATEVLLVVQGNGEQINATGELFAFTREIGSDGKPGVWKEQILFEPVKLGRKGTGKTTEGDEKTPLGWFQMNTPFGIRPAQEGFPKNYIQVTDSMYWDGDTTSSTYNRLVDRKKTKAFNPASSEHLIDYVPYYNYALNIGYNADCVKGAGSALFVHCLGPAAGNTGGCIAIGEENMIRILQLYRENKTKILIANRGEFSRYYYNWAEGFGVPLSD